MNVLSSPLLSLIPTEAGKQRVSLPELFVLAAADGIRDFPALRAHQAPAWHMFLVQLGVLASLEAGGTLPQTASDWRDALRALTPGFEHDEPWCLMVEDWTLPAFLQPPVQTKRCIADYKRQIATPDELDILVTSKNHELKSQRMKHASGEEWLYALLCLQSMEGFLGAGNYGIARMNGGFASRPMMRMHASGLGPGGQWLRDVTVLLESQDTWQRHAKGLGIGTQDSAARLLWTSAWDGKESLSLSHLHPLSVEVCRRVRLRQNEAGQMHVVAATSKVARVDASAARGVVADPWIPIDLGDDKKGPKSFSPTSEGFGYRRMTRLMDPAQYRPALLQKASAQEKRSSGPITMVAACLTRGQGKTEGFYERRIAWGASASQLFLSDELKVVRRAQSFVEASGVAVGKVLRPALILLLDGSAQPDWANPTYAQWVRPWLSRMDKAIDQCFFRELDASFEANENDVAADTRWSGILAGLIRTLFEQARIATPINAERCYLAEGRAKNLLEKSLNKQFPGLLTTNRSEEQNNATVE